jgi:lysozyme
MKASERAINLIMKYEQLRLQAYKPTPNDVPTIGWGHTHGVQMGQTITVEQAEDFLRNKDVPGVEQSIARLIKAPLTQNRFDALVSLCFNIGGAPTMFRLINEMNYVDAAKEFDKWVHQGGKVLKGLVTRRAEERKLFEEA